MDCRNSSKHGQCTAANKQLISLLFLRLVKTGATGRHSEHGGKSTAPGLNTSCWPGRAVPIRSTLPELLLMLMMLVLQHMQQGKVAISHTTRFFLAGLQPDYIAGLTAMMSHENTPSSQHRGNICLYGLSKPQTVTSPNF